jgi:hypothetical protein
VTLSVLIVPDVIIDIAFEEDTSLEVLRLVDFLLRTYKGIELSLSRHNEDEKTTLSYPSDAIPDIITLKETITKKLHAIQD